MSPFLCTRYWAIILLYMTVLRVTRSHYSGLSPASCSTRGCPVNFVCERREYRRLSARPECIPDVAASIRARLVEWNLRWNSQDYEALEEFYTVDSLFLPPGADIRRGRDGFAEFISGLIAVNNWGTATWSLDSVVPISGDRVSTVDLFEIQSSNGGPTTFGKEVAVWRLVNGIYLIEYECINFN